MRLAILLSLSLVVTAAQCLDIGSTAPVTAFTAEWPDRSVTTLSATGNIGVHYADGQTFVVVDTAKLPCIGIRVSYWSGSAWVASAQPCLSGPETFAQALDVVGGAKSKFGSAFGVRVAIQTETGGTFTPVPFTSDAKPAVVKNNYLAPPTMVSNVAYFYDDGSTGLPGARGTADISFMDTSICEAPYAIVKIRTIAEVSDTLFDSSIRLLPKQKALTGHIYAQRLPCMLPAGAGCLYQGSISFMQYDAVGDLKLGASQAFLVDLREPPMGAAQ
jgi:hypothetical protein